MSSDDLWKDYDDKDDVGQYAPDVPHASIRTPNGKIDPKYITNLEQAKAACRKEGN